MTILASWPALVKASNKPQLSSCKTVSAEHAIPTFNDTGPELLDGDGGTFALGLGRPLPPEDAIEAAMGGVCEEEIADIIPPTAQN